MVLRGLFGAGRKDRDRAHGLYVQIVAQARDPGFYVEGRVADSVDGRFDMILIHMFLVLNWLKRQGPATKDLGQALFDIMMADMDRSLREMGVSDYAIARRMKGLITAFYGRIQAYDAGLTGESGVLEAALRRNLYRGDSESEAVIAAMAGYIRREVETLAQIDLADVDPAGNTGSQPALFGPGLAAAET